jgi:hypothetical protein
MATSTPPTTYSGLGHGDVESLETDQIIETTGLLDTSNTRNQTAYSCIKQCLCVVFTILIIFLCSITIEHILNNRRLHAQREQDEQEYECVGCDGECLTSCSTCACIMISKDCFENSTWTDEPCWRDTHSTKLVELNFYSEGYNLCGGPNIDCGL